MGRCTPKEIGRGGRVRSRMGVRRAWVLVVVHLAITAHLTHWWLVGRTVSPLEPSEAMAFTKQGIVNAGLIFFAASSLATLLWGRFFCGWGCHMVALQDLARWLLLRVGIRPRPLRSRLLAWVPLIAFVYMFLLPLWMRPETPSTRLALLTNAFWRTFPPWWAALITFFVCGFLVIYLLGSKGFCTYACPYGGLYSALDRLAPTRIRVDDRCESCGLCTAVCSSNVDVKREVGRHGMVVDSGCMKCLDCVTVCPKNALRLGFGAPAGLRSKVRPGKHPTWREELLGAGVFAATFFSLRGLYGIVPFLLALGLAGCMVGVVARVRKGARGWRTATALAALFVAHSAFVQIEGHRSARAFERLAVPRSTFFSSQRLPLTQDQNAATATVLSAGGRAAAWSLLPDPRRELELGWAHLLRGDLAAAETYLRRAAGHARHPATLLLELGNLRRLRGDREGALESYRQALASQPAHPFAADMLAELLVESADQALAEGKPDRAQAHFTEALSLQPGNLEVRAALVELHLARSDREGALDLLRAGVALAPTDPAPLRVLAFTHLTLGELDQAAEACARAAELPDPDGETARLALRIEAARGK